MAANQKPATREASGGRKECDRPSGTMLTENCLPASDRQEIGSTGHSRRSTVAAGSTSDAAQDGREFELDGRDLAFEFLDERLRSIAAYAHLASGHAGLGVLAGVKYDVGMMMAHLRAVEATIADVEAIDARGKERAGWNR